MEQLAIFIVKASAVAILVSFGIGFTINLLRDAMVHIHVAQNKMWQERQQFERNEAKEAQKQAIEEFKNSLQVFRNDFASDLNRRTKELQEVLNRTVEKGPVQ